MKPMTATATLVVALITGPLLAPAAEADGRRERGGHGADRVTEHVVIDRRRHGGMHKVHGERRHDRRGYQRHRWLGRGYGHGRSHGRWHSRWRGPGHAGHHYRNHRYRDQRRYGWYGYGISFELDGIRYQFGEGRLR